MPLSWLTLSLLAFTGFGLQNFLYKVAAMRGQRSHAVTFYFVLISTVVLWILLLASELPLSFSPIVVVLASFDAILFYGTTLTRIEALRYIPVHLAFPLLRVSTLLVALFGVTFFNEPATWQLGLAVILLLVAAYLIACERRDDSAISLNYKLGLLLSALALLTSAGTNVITKFASLHTALLDYMVLANTLIIVLSYTELRIIRGRTLSLPTKDELLVASGLALSNIIGWFAYLYALRIGPLSSTAVISGMGFILPIILAAVIYREKLSKTRILAILCTVACVVLLKSR